MRVRTPTTSLPAAALLDPGEAAALALAREIRAAAVLIDEKKGRGVAKAAGFATVGTITVLELAAQRNLLNLKSAFNALLQTSFQISKALIDSALEREAARKIAKRNA